MKLLEKHIVETAMNRALVDIVAKRDIKPSDIDWYLPLYSSDYFRDKFHQGMKQVNFYLIISALFFLKRLPPQLPTYQLKQKL